MQASNPNLYREMGLHYSRKLPKHLNVVIDHASELEGGSTMEQLFTITSTIVEEVADSQDRYHHIRPFISSTGGKLARDTTTKAHACMHAYTPHTTLSTGRPRTAGYISDAVCPTVSAATCHSRVGHACPELCHHPFTTVSGRCRSCDQCVPIASPTLSASFLLAALLLAPQP